MRYKTYCAGGIMNCDSQQANEWRDYVISKLGAAWCLNPMRRDYRGKELENIKSIVELDKKDIDDAQIVLVNYDSVRGGWGTCMETHYSWDRRKLVVLVAGADTVVSPWALYHCHQKFTTLDAAIDYIKNINDKVTNIRQYIEQFYEPAKPVTRGDDLVKELQDQYRSVKRGNINLKDMIPDSTLVCGPGLPMGNAIIIGGESCQR